MLQQTTVATVIPYFLHFIKTWPTLTDLAHAPLDDILVAWQGLGYYSRARNLHKCSQEVVNNWQGQLPDDESSLLSLPGIGPYTAAAIRSIAYDKPAAAVDGNVIRVLSRYFALSEPRPGLDKHVREKLTALVPSQRCGDFTQSLMELGAIICRPKSPTCDRCPLASNCQGKNTPEDFPTPTKKKSLPTRYAVAYLIERKDGAILLQRRSDSGMLGGMMEVPSTPWADQLPGDNIIKAHEPLPLDDWAPLKGYVKHTFSHFHFHIKVHYIQISMDDAPATHTWAATHEMDNYALPTVMKKIIRHAKL